MERDSTVGGFPPEFFVVDQRELLECVLGKSVAVGVIHRFRVLRIRSCSLPSRSFAIRFSPTLHLEKYVRKADG